MKNQCRILIFWCACTSFAVLDLLLINVEGWTFPRGITKLILWHRQRQYHHNKIVQFSYQDAVDESMVDRYFMQQALDSAQKAAKSGEVPVGAMIVRNITAMELIGQQQQQKQQPPSHRHHHNKQQQTSMKFEILSIAANRVERDCDASAHAELLALRQAARRIHNWRLQNCTLYSTLEPCPMCLSAALAFRIDRLVYGAPDLRLGAVETYQQMLQQQHPFHNITLVQAGVYQEESARLLREFFQTKRRIRQPASYTTMQSKKK